jgi:ABC-type Fe3+-hydroxamate transport system substrate-binding protein
LRVVSLVPSVTETLLDWRVDVVACTRFCEQPTIRHVGGTKDPDVAAIAGLAPDLVVVDEEENRRPDHDALVAAGLAVAVTAVRSIADVDVALALLADAVGRPRPPSVVPPFPPSTRRAFTPIWRRPWMTVSADTYVADSLRSVGIASAFADRPDRYPTVTDDEIVASAPDLVVAPDEPYAFGERHRAELERFAPTTFLDGKLVTWWGSRTPQRLAALATALG